MAFDKSGLDGYNDVASRMAEFFTKHPDGTLQPANPAEPFRVQEVAGKAFVVYTAAAYRTPDDPRPGIGIAWEPFPGRTPYTKDSEVMNAETSAWGRAILAVGAADTRKGVASREEVRNRQADREEEWEMAEKPPTDAQITQFNDYATRIDNATTEQHIANVKELVADARGAEKLTHSQYRQLGFQAVAKLAELRGITQ